jgi:UDP-N-acetylmuramoyl-tripeptide--D-alanyl-D-alanine ligase
MSNIYVKDIITKFNGRLLIGDENLVLDNFSKDTREIKENDIYVGIKGEKFDGNLFYKDAFNIGAKCAILEHINEDEIKEYHNKTIILVDNSIKLLQDLARYKRSLYNIPVIAITGSVGKTSTKDMIASVLSKKFNVLKSEANNNNHLGLPLTILKLKDHNALVVEMGMNNFGEISLLTNIAKPNVAVITNIGTAHIGNLGSRENILKAKLEILEGLDPNGVLLINNDNDLLHKELPNLNKKIKVITIGIQNRSDYMATEIKEENLTSNFLIDKDKIKLNIISTPFIYNALMAYAIGKHFNIESSKIVKGLEEFKLSANRLEIKLNKNNIKIIDDTYNANLDSIKSGLETLKNIDGKRKIAILGDILELGNFAKEIHEEVGKTLVNTNPNLIILIGDNSKITYDKVLSLGYPPKQVYYFKKAEDSFVTLDNILESEDTILIKGSHAMNLILIVNYLLK